MTQVRHSLAQNDSSSTLDKPDDKSGDKCDDKSDLKSGDKSDDKADFTSDDDCILFANAAILSTHPDDWGQGH